MTSEKLDWQAPEVTPLSDADGASGHPSRPHPQRHPQSQPHPA